MYRLVLILLCLFIFSASYCQEDTQQKIKFRKLTYNNFQKLSINDTSAAVIDLFFDKKDNAIFNQMSMLPMSVILTVTPLMHFVGVASAGISVPFFINGSRMLVRYRKKKLYDVLIEYEKTQTLPDWVRRKANRKLKNYELLQINY